MNDELTHVIPLPQNQRAGYEIYTGVVDCIRKTWGYVRLSYFSGCLPTLDLALCYLVKECARGANERLATVVMERSASSE
jgi:hypothetical protein